MSEPTCCAPTSASARTGATSRGARSNARSYRFDVLADYGAFRDLQRHRLLTLDWQPLGTEHGYIEPAAIEEAGALADWRSVMERSAALARRRSARTGLDDAAPVRRRRWRTACGSTWT